MSTYSVPSWPVFPFVRALGPPPKCEDAWGVLQWESNEIFGVDSCDFIQVTHRNFAYGRGEYRALVFWRFGLFRIYRVTTHRLPDQTPIDQRLCSYTGPLSQHIVHALGHLFGLWQHTNLEGFVVDGIQCYSQMVARLNVHISPKGKIVAIHHWEILEGLPLCGSIGNDCVLLWCERHLFCVRWFVSCSGKNTEMLRLKMNEGRNRQTTRKFQKIKDRMWRSKDSR